MKNSNKVKYSFLGGVFFIFLLKTFSVKAGLISDELWQIQAGDQLSVIVASFAPSVQRSAAELEAIVKRLNPAAFDNQGDLITGRVIRIPGAKISAANTVNTNTYSSADNTAAPSTSNISKSPVAHVVVSDGSLQAIDERGSLRALNRHAQIFEGDKLRTSESGYAQLRFTDGAIIALRPSTEFKVDSYRFAGAEDGTEQGVFSLLKGGFRTITGLIGKKNKQNYRVNTTVATIGIRGTHYGLRLCDAGSCNENGGNLEAGLYGGVVDGSIEIHNNTGNKIFSNDQYFHVRSLDSTARGLLAPPAIIFNGEELKLSKPAQLKNTKEDGDFRGASLRGNTEGEKTAAMIRHNKHGIDKALFIMGKDVRNSGGEVAGLPFRLAPKGASMLFGNLGHNMAQGYYFSLAGAMRSDGTLDSFIFLDPKRLITNPLSAFMDLSDNRDPNNIYAIAQGKETIISNIGLNGKYDAVWGRWHNDYKVVFSGNQKDTKGAMHFIYSPSTTTKEQILSLQSPISAVVNYQKIGGTRPTDIDGNEGLLTNATMSVDFSNLMINSYDVRTQHVGDSYHGTASGVSILSLLDDPLNSFSLSGSCMGTICGLTVPTSLTGSASVVFLNGANTDPLVNAAASTFSLNGMAIDPNGAGIAVGSTGAVLFERLP